MRALTPSQLERPRAWAVAAGALALVIAFAAFLALRDAGPADAAKATTIGDTGRTPKPSCPGNTCEAVGSVTGFQQAVDGKKGVFKAPKDGRIVAWGAELSKPDKDQRKFFGDFYRDNEFGTNPAARLSILKPKKKSNFKLKSQSPAVALNSELGREPVVTLKDPLRVKKGDVIGLTVPTWLSNFAVNQSRDTYWRASRHPERCTGNKNIQEGRPQTEVGSSRRYGCKYTTARILYWAQMVKDGGGGNGGGDGGGNGDGGNN